MILSYYCVSVCVKCQGSNPEPYTYTCKVSALLLGYIPSPFVYGSHLVVLRTDIYLVLWNYSYLCAQSSLLVGHKGLHRCWGLNLSWHLLNKHLTSCTNSPVPISCSFILFYLYLFHFIACDFAKVKCYLCKLFLEG